MDLTLYVWRQKGPDSPGKLEEYQAKDISPDMSFLDMLDVVNGGGHRALMNINQSLLDAQRPWMSITAWPAPSSTTKSSGTSGSVGQSTRLTRCVQVLSEGR